MTRLIACLLLIPAAVMAVDWQVDRTRSRLGFVATWEKEPFDGVFDGYSPLIRFDPAQPASAYVDFIVDVTSVDTGNSERDEGMGDPDWFDFKKFPEAYFRARGAKMLDAGRYEIEGTLIIKGHERRLRFPVVWKLDGDSAYMSGETTIDRRDFGLGEGDWKEDASIGFEVKIQFELILMPQS